MRWQGHPQSEYLVDERGSMPAEPNTGLIGIGWVLVLVWLWAVVLGCLLGYGFREN
jgi:hypothetical protein